ncbi:MAG: tetratricopeptide repeat protein [Planctomycetes bacterium]|nr:tetratricopeptide repeat protein [Planctomycetota bacterium]
MSSASSSMRRNPRPAFRWGVGVALLLLSTACGPTVVPPTIDAEIPWSDLEVNVTRTLREAVGAVDMAPASAVAWEELGLRLAAHQLDAAAWSALTFALELDDSRVEAASALADLARFGGRPVEEVLSWYDRALALSPDHAPLWTGRGDALSAAGRAEEAEASYRQALELWPELKRARSRLGRVLVQREAYEEGLQLLRPLLEEHPDDAPCATAMAQALAALGQDDEAALWAERARAADGETVPLEDPRRIDLLSRQRASRYLFLRARAALDRGELARATVDLAAALEGQPDAYNARALLARALLAQRRIAEAEEQLRRALETRPGHPESLRLLGQVIHQAGDDRQAIDLLEAAAAAEPLDPGSSLALGSSWLRVEDPQRALPHLEAAAAGSPELADAWFRLALAREGVGDAQGAAEAREEGRRLDPSHPLAKTSGK